MPVLNVAENNSVAFTQIAGTFSTGTPDFKVLGLAIAGRSAENVGGAGLKGIYGTLVVASDGSFTYNLDNNDPDVDALGSGMSALESFTYTYIAGGNVLSGRAAFRIAGLDEVGQLITRSSASIDLSSGNVIGTLQRIESTAQYAVLLNNPSGQPIRYTNNGTVSVDSTSFESLGFGIYSGGRTELLNNGLFSVISHLNAASGANLSNGSTLINNGVIRAFADRPRDQNMGTYAGRVVGSGGGPIVNNGLIEATSVYGEAIGLNYTQWLVNNGVIRVSAPGLPRYSDGRVDLFALTGIRGSGAGAFIDNRGVIDMISTSANGVTVAIYLFPDSSNPHSTGTIINSGRIIADVAILSSDGYNVALNITNSGHIEGELQRATGGLDVVRNLPGGEWIGHLNFGFGADLVLNSGFIQGAVDLNDGNDLFDGRGGSVAGTVSGGPGNDILIGGSAADILSGGDGTDVIQGGGGADRLTGGSGADVFAYVIANDSTNEARDSILDFQSGVDRLDLTALSPTQITFTRDGDATIVSGISSSGSFSISVLGSIAMEDLILTRVSPTDGADTLRADDAGGDLRGLGGDDLLAGGAGRDRIDGGSGADTMIGGPGDDIYFVDNANDRILEASNDGYDVVYSAIDFSLEAGIEDAFLTGNNSIGMLGNGLNNRIEGNSASNLLRGGAGDDVLTGGLGGDVLDGGTGSDRFIYTSIDDSPSGNPDHLIAFASGVDVIDVSLLSPYDIQLTPISYIWADPFGAYATIFSDWTIATIRTLSGSLTLWIDGTVALSDFRAIGPARFGGTLTDFNGDGRSDLLTRSSTGEISLLRGQANGSLIQSEQLAANPIDANWKIVGRGDFNGDGKDDILWRHSSGVIGEWLGQAGQFTNNSGVAANLVDNSWSVVGVGDYNGDGREDILWRHTSGEIGQWLSASNGAFANNGGAAANLVDPSWTVVASGDFNGDGKVDVLWRHASGVYAEWQGSASGKLNNVGGVLGGANGLVVGSGDFNGDGRDDILMRDARTGAITLSLGQSNGQFIASTPVQQLPDLQWKILAIGDFNGDGRDDLIWRHSSGAGLEWLATTGGDFANSGAVPNLPNGWSVQSPDIWIV